MVPKRTDRMLSKFGTRWQRVQSYAVIGAWTNAAYLDDDEFTVEDIDETLYAASMLGLIWSPQIAVAVGVSTTPLNVVEGAALAGLAVSFAIGGVEGAETYVDYITDPVDMFQNEEKLETLVQASDIVQTVINPLHLPVKMITEFGMKKLPWQEIFKNRWMTGPSLPF